VQCLVWVPNVDCQARGGCAIPRPVPENMPRILEVDNTPPRSQGGGAKSLRTPVSDRKTGRRTSSRVGNRRANSLPPQQAHGRQNIISVPKSHKSRAVILAELQKHFVVQELPKAVQERIGDAMYMVNAKAGEVVIEQGTVGDRFYVLEEGALDVFVDKKLVTSLEAPASFGEMALLHAAPRAATLRATENCRMWAVDRDNFKHFVATAAVANATEKLKLLRKVNILKPLTTEQMTSIAEAVTEEEFAEGENIITQGDTDAKHFYIIESGSVDVIVNGNKMVTLTDGQFFGERALLVSYTSSVVRTMASRDVRLPSI